MIVTFATENYKNYLLMLLDSYFYFNKNKRAEIFLVAWSDFESDKIRSKYSKAVFHNISADESVKNRVSRGKRVGDILKKKPQIILDVYKRTEEPFLWIDADSLVLSDLTPLLVKLQGEAVDLMCTHRENHSKEHAKFAVAVLGFGTHSSGEALLEEYVEETNCCEGVKGWFHEQLALQRVFARVKPNLYPLSEKEHSIRRTKNTLIFSRRVNFEYNKMRELLKDRGVYAV